MPKQKHSPDTSQLPGWQHELKSFPCRFFRCYPKGFTGLKRDRSDPSNRRPGRPSGYSRVSAIALTWRP
jgi:hypothetical protein